MKTIQLQCKICPNIYKVDGNLKVSKCSCNECGSTLWEMLPEKFELKVLRNALKTA